MAVSAAAPPRFVPGAVRGYLSAMSEDQARRITEEQVRHVAKLSRLELSDEQVHRFADQLEHVLEHVGKLEALDVEHVEPMAHALDLANVLRDDAERQGLTNEQALANAPAKNPPFFKVPKVLGEGSGA